MKTVNTTIKKAKALRHANAEVANAQLETSKQPSPEKTLKDFITWQYENIDRLVAHASGKAQLETSYALVNPYDERTQEDDARFLSTFQNLRKQIIKAKRELACLKGAA